MRGWGTIRPRPDRGGYQVSIVIDGRRIRRLYPSEKLAKDGLKTLQHAKAVGAPAGADERLTYGDVAPLLIREYEAKGHTPRTLGAYKSEVDQALKHWRDRRMARSRPGDFWAWIRGCQRAGLAASTIRHLCDRLSQMHGIAERDELVATPLCRVPRPKLQSRRRDPVPEEDLRKLLDASAADPDPRPRAILLLAADAGLRAAEIAGLERVDVDLRVGWIRVRHAKGGRERHVPIITTRLRDALQRLQGGGRSLLGASHRSGPQRLLRGVWERALKGTPQLHRLRHRFGTIAMGAAGVSPRAVRDLLGHSTLVTTDRYVYAMPPVVAPALRVALEGSGKAPSRHQAARKNLGTIRVKR